MAILSMFADSFWGLATLGLWAFALYSAVFYYHWLTRTPKYPGPLPFPVIGNFVLFLRKSNGGDISEFVMWMNRKYGDRCEFWMLGERHIIYSNADDVARMFTASTENNYLTRTPPKDGLNEIGLGNNGIVFNRDLGSWRLHRKFFTRAMSSLKLTTTAVVLTCNLFHELEAHWKELGPEPALDLNEWTHRIAADIITTIATGKSDGAMKRFARGETQGSDLVYKIDCFFNAAGYFLTVPDFFRKVVLRPLTQKLLHRRTDLLEHVMGIINETQNNIADIPKNFITEQLLHNLDDETRSMSLEEIGYNLAEMLGGGIDTTSNTLSFIVYYLAQNPHVEQRLVAELQEVFGDSDRDITDSDLPRLKYLHAVVNEVMRVHPVSPLLWKTPSADDVINGELLQAGTQTLVNIRGIHLNAAHWKDPKTFNPDRFIQEKVYSGAFVPFGGGLRICPGRILAIVELRVIIASLYRKYKLELLEPNVRSRFTIVTHCESLRVRVIPRKKVA